MDRPEPPIALVAYHLYSKESSGQFTNMQEEDTKLMNSTTNHNSCEKLHPNYVKMLQKYGYIVDYFRIVGYIIANISG